MAGDLGLMFDRHRADSLPKLALPDRMRFNKVPGVSIALIRNYRVAWVKGYGVMDSAAGRIVTDQTLFQAASYRRS